jgi:tetratricopeptide (TPR) repeat protein/predicted Ser/Thr protein kinase
VVWKAEDTVLGRTVAIKVLPADVSRDDQRRRMFLDEARLASSLNEAHIAQVHEFAREGDLDFIVMEFVDGRPLTKLLMGRPLPPEKIADWGLQIGQALSRAHRKGLLHRDIKPANMLITADGDVKVVDFGVATLFGRGTIEEQPTMVGESTEMKTVTTMREPASQDKVAGTLPYMSPEQIRGEKLGVHSDIFSLGVVLYEMTTGQRPFAAQTPDDLAAAISQARPAPVHDLVPQVPLDLDRIIHKALAPKSADRYQTMEDLAVDLRRLGRDLESGSSPAYEDLKHPSAPAPVKHVPAKLVAGAAIAVVLLLAGAGLAGWFMNRGSTSAAPAPAAGDKTVLVLPLEVRGQTEGAEYVGRAFAEAVAVNLAQARDLRVLPVPESRELGETGALDRARAARELGAGLLLTGAITRDGEAVHASLNMVDTVENRIVWGSQRDAPEGDLAGLASTMAREGLRGITPAAPSLYGAPLTLTGGPAMSASSLTGVALGALRRQEDAAALEATEALVAAFPGEHDALVLRAVALNRQPGDEPLPGGPELLEATLAALERLDPSSPFPAFYGALALEDPKRTVEELSRALEREDLSPGLRFNILRARAWTTRRIGNVSGAVADMEEALRLQPASARGLADLGYFLREAGRAEEALGRSRQAVALEPTWWRGHHQLGHVLSGLQRYHEAAEAYQEACRLGEHQYSCAGAAGALLQAGRKDEAMAMAATAAAMPESSAGSYNLACFWAQAGDPEKSLTYLRRSIEIGGAFAWFANDPDLIPLHGDPEYERIIAEVGANLDSGQPAPAPERPPGR